MVPLPTHEETERFTENPLRNDEIPHRFIVTAWENVIKITKRIDTIPPRREPASLRLAA